MKLLKELRFYLRNANGQNPRSNEKRNELQKMIQIKHLIKI
jgi:hypothetical protein